MPVPCIMCAFQFSMALVLIDTRRLCLSLPLQLSSPHPHAHAHLRIIAIPRGLAERVCKDLRVMIGLKNTQCHFQTNSIELCKLTTPRWELAYRSKEEQLEACEMVASETWILFWERVYRDKGVGKNCDCEFEVF